MILRGKAISPGVVDGVAHVVDAPTLLAQAQQIPPQGAPHVEIERLNAAIGRAAVQLDRIRRQLVGRVPTHDIGIFAAHAGLLRDSKFIAQIEGEIHENGLSAEAAVARVVRGLYATFRSSPVTLVQDKASDILDIGRRLVQCLSQAAHGDDEFGDRAIIVATALTPSELVHYAHQGVVGFVTESCGPKSHTAILARGMALPFITQIKGVSETIPHGARLVLDAAEGVAIAAPTEAEEALVQEVMSRAPALRPRIPVPQTPPITRDQVAITVLLNISDPTEADAVVQLAADGIGLFRTEFLYIDRDWWLTEDQNYELYRDVAERIGDRELNIRLVDFGAEKCPPYADIPVNRNPSLGLRGIRLLLQREDILKPQIRALARLGKERSLTVLLPMLDSVDTLHAAMEATCRLCECRSVEQLPFRVGTMIEVPAAAAMIEHILPHVDAISVGLNDLTQYLLAADRDDELVGAYHDALEPAVLHTVRRLIEAAARAGKRLTICGELAGDPHLTNVLLGLGVRRLSVSRSSYPELVRAIGRLSLEESRQFAERALQLTSRRAVRELLAGKGQGTDGS